MFTLSTLKEYLLINPNATLKEYYEYLENIKNKQIEDEKRKEKELNDFYESLIGKYFYYSFNSSSRMYLQVTKNLNTHTSPIELAYTMFVTNTQSNYEITDRYINKLWCKDFVEISKQNFDIVKEFFEKRINTKLSSEDQI